LGLAWDDEAQQGRRPRQQAGTGQKRVREPAASSGASRGSAIQRLQTQLEEEGLAVEFRAAVAVVRPDSISFSVGFPLTPEAFLLAVVFSRLQGAGQEEEEPPVAPIAQPIVPMA